MQLGKWNLALVFRADSVDVVFSIFPGGTKGTYSQPTDKLHVVTTAAASCEESKGHTGRTTGHTTIDGVPHQSDRNEKNGIVNHH